MWCPDVKVGKEEQINLHLEMQLVNLNQSVFFDLRGDSLSQFVQHRFTQALMFHEGALAQAAHASH